MIIWSVSLYLFSLISILIFSFGSIVLFVDETKGSTLNAISIQNKMPKVHFWNTMNSERISTPWKWHMHVPFEYEWENPKFELVRIVWKCLNGIRNQLLCKSSQWKGFLINDEIGFLRTDFSMLAHVHVHYTTEHNGLWMD